MFTEANLLFTRNSKGFLFIGDPHVFSRRPGRRKDDYLTSVIDKLQECASLCVEHSLVPVILGDLFHKNDDNRLSMLNRLIRTLQMFPIPPFVLEGNHDKEQTLITDNDAITLLGLTNTIQIVSQDWSQIFNFEGALVRLVACPHGSAIPSDLGAFSGTSVMITHHDLAFGSSYIGSTPLTAVDNCDMVVNGHMHDTKKPVKVGSTWWTNPGNIEPLSVDLSGHSPCAWEWRPDFEGGFLQPFVLTHGTDLFDLAGIQVEAASADLAVASLQPQASKFAMHLSAQAAGGAAKTDDASVLMEDLEEVLSASGVSEATKLLMQSVATGLMQKLTGATADSEIQATV